MATLTIRIPDEKQERLAELAKHLGVSVNKLVEELVTIRLAQFDAEVRFQRMVAEGSIQGGLKVLERLERGFAKREKRRRDS